MNKNKVGFSIALYLILVLSLVLSSCTSASTPTQAPGSTNAPSNATQAPSSGKTKLVIWIQAAEQFTTAHGNIAKAYMDKNPNVEVEVQSFDWADFPTKLTTALASNTGPDLVEAYSPWMMAYIRTGKIDPVPDSFLSRAQIAEKYYSSTLALLDYNDKYYGIPSNLSADQTRVLLVNDKTVNDAKVNLDDNKTMEDFIKDWQALTVVGSDGKMTRAGLGMVCAEPPYQFTSYLMEYGGSILTEDGKKAALNSEAGKKAFQFMMDLIEKYKVDSPDLTDFSCLGTGTAATSYRGTWFVPVLKADYPDFTYHFIKMPLPPGATVELWNGGSGWATFVPANSANKEAAWTYLKFVEENREQWIKATGEIPADKQLAAKVAQENPDLYGVYYPILEQSKHGWPYGDYFAIYDALAAMFTSVATKNATIDQALATAETTINTSLDQWWTQFGNK